MDINKFYEKINDKNISLAKLDLEHAYKYLRKCRKQNPNYSFEELIASIDGKTIHQANKYYDCLQEISGIPYQLIASDYLVKNPKKLSNIYSKFKNKNIKIKETMYSYDISKSSNILVQSLLKIIRERSNNNNKTLTKEEEFSLLNQYLTTIPPFLEDIYKKDNIKLLLFVKDVLNDYDLLSQLVDSHNLQQSTLWLEDLKYNMEFEESFPKNLGVNNILTEENLSKMSSEELAILNIFWQNKYAKKLGDLNVGFFLAQQLHLNNIKTPPSDDLTKNLLAKYKFLESTCYKFYNGLVKKETDSKSIDEYINNISDDYKKSFSEIMPNMKHDLRTDISQCMDRIFALKNTYSAKSNLTCSTILNLLDTKKIRNWGYINDNKSSQTNTIQNQDYFVLIGIDCPGLNKPVKVHIEREILANCILNAKSETLIPLYEGNEDYDINFEQLKTHIVLPFEKSHKDFLRNTVPSTSNFNYFLLSHTKFLANQDKFPEHLKVTDSKGKKVRKRKFIDLFNGRVFVEEGKKRVPDPETPFIHPLTIESNTNSNFDDFYGLDEI